MPTAPGPAPRRRASAPTTTPDRHQRHAGPHRQQLRRGQPPALQLDQHPGEVGKATAGVRHSRCVCDPPLRPQHLDRQPDRRTGTDHRRDDPRPQSVLRGRQLRHDRQRGRQLYDLRLDPAGRPRRGRHERRRQHRLPQVLPLGPAPHPLRAALLPRAGHRLVGARLLGRDVHRHRTELPARPGHAVDLAAGLAEPGRVDLAGRGRLPDGPLITSATPAGAPGPTRPAAAGNLVHLCP